MYENFYSFNGMPFQLAPDGRFYFGSQEHSKAMSYLEYGIAQREGFVVVTGEIGAGKTTLVEHLLETIDHHQYVTARIVTTQLSGYDTLCMIGAAFNLYSEGMDKSALIGRLTKFFANLRSQEKYPLIIVDEAQSLTTEAIEEIRMLSNIVLGGGAPFQGILLGQPEFRTSLSRPELRQFRQRVIASCHLGALSAEDTRKYIEHRLGRVGWTANPSISDSAFLEIHRRSAGIPRRINTLCSRLLLLGYLEGSHAINSMNVVNVSDELNAEAGPVDTDRLWRQDDYTIAERLDAPAAGNEILSRLAKLERTADKLDRAVVRALDLMLRYLPQQGLK
jgi:putative secretion ATPase (PEP-CTERM system associated)